MTESRTARMSLPQWDAGTDSGSRADFDEAFANIEQWAARDEQGLRSARPAAGIRGRYYFATDTGAMYREDGTTWFSVGSIIDGLASVRQTSGQTGDLWRAVASDGSTILSKFDVSGVFTTKRAVLQGEANGATVDATAGAAGQIGLLVKGASGQTANLLEARDNTGVVKALVSPAGNGYFVGRGAFGATSGPSTQLYVKAGGSNSGLYVQGNDIQVPFEIWNAAATAQISHIDTAGSAYFANVVAKSLTTNGDTKVALVRNGTGNAYLEYRSPTDLPRWRLITQNAESSGNQGSDLNLTAYNDAGSGLWTPLVISRVSQQTTFTNRQFRIVGSDPGSLVTVIQAPTAQTQDVFYVYANGVWSFVVKSNGDLQMDGSIAAYASRPLSAYATAGFSTPTDGSEAAISGCEGTFVAPRSGRVKVSINSLIRATVSGSYANVYVKVRTGGTIGAGTEQAGLLGGGTALATLTNSDTIYIRAGNFDYIDGLTPGATYNFRAYANRTIGSGGAAGSGTVAFIEPTF